MDAQRVFEGQRLPREVLDSVATALFALLDGSDLYLTSDQKRELSSFIANFSRAHEATASAFLHIAEFDGNADSTTAAAVFGCAQAGFAESRQLLEQIVDSPKVDVHDKCRGLVDILWFTRSRLADLPANLVQRITVSAGGYFPAQMRRDLSEEPSDRSAEPFSDVRRALPMWHELWHSEGHLDQAHYRYSERTCDRTLKKSRIEAFRVELEKRQRADEAPTGGDRTVPAP